MSVTPTLPAPPSPYLDPGAVSCEGTREIQTLIVARAVAGLSAFVR
jgi:hypothetical protein